MAEVPFSPSVQYLTAGAPGVIRCHWRSNPPPQFTTWYRNRRVFNPAHLPGVSVLPNCSLLIDNVSKGQEGDR